ncbi:MAG: hypothetical protein HW388_1043 [Dehalococcoidia bacterium]|nr:hypothetical protein [Dehalococcoidia bacterium]
MVLSTAIATLLAVGFVLLGTISCQSSAPGISATATPVGDGWADGGAVTYITEERAIELAVQYGRSGFVMLKEFTGVHDIGKMKYLDFFALRGGDPGPTTVSYHQNTVVWVVSLEGLRESCSPPDFYGKYHCGEYDNLYVVLDAITGRVYSWGSMVAGPLTIPKGE